MPTAASFELFEKELARLAGIFERNLAEFKGAGYVEAQLRDDFLNPFFRALGWDLENRAGLIQSKREVEIESRTEIEGRQKRADYLFRTEGQDRFICEAKKPAEELSARGAFQAKRYAWNKSLPLAILTDFEEFKVYIVGGRPHIDEPLAGLWKTWHFRELLPAAKEVWSLLARDSIAGGSIDRLIETLPKTPAGKGKVRQQWLIKPDRSRALDVDFLNFLDEARRELGFDLIRNNDRADLLEGNKLNEAVQRILDRILFLRICEARDIDTGVLLDSIVPKPGSEITPRRKWFAPTKSRWNCMRNRRPVSATPACARPTIRSGGPSSAISARWIAARLPMFRSSTATSSSRISARNWWWETAGWPGSWRI